jgi:hypothetical protein
VQNEFVPYTEALALKELGFDEPCFGLYHNDKTCYPTQCKSHEQFHGQICSAPLYQQAFRWFREKKIHSIVQEYDINNYMFSIDDGINRDIEVTGYDSYEKAELECLKQLIKIVKDGKSHSNS